MMTSPTDDVWTIKPAWSFQVAMYCFSLPFIALSAAGMWAMAGNSPLWEVIVYPSGIFGIAALLVLEAATVRLHLSEDRLWLTRYWHTRWSVPRDSLEIVNGRVGDLPLIPGLKVIDRRLGKEVGEIISHQFSIADLAQLRALVR